MARRKKTDEEEIKEPVPNWKGKFVRLEEKDASRPYEYYGVIQSQEGRDLSGIFVEFVDNEPRRIIEEATFSYDDWNFYPSDKAKVSFMFQQSLQQAELALMQKQIDLDLAKFEKSQSEELFKKAKV